jgi:UDP-N-acetylmuramate dehydrogenase
VWRFGKGPGPPCHTLRVHIQENVPLASLTTLKVGGPARYFLEAHTVADVGEAVDYARSRNLPLFVLGGGTNLLVADNGWPGLVLKIAITGINHEGHHPVRFEAGAGEDWDEFVALTVKHDCAGLECLSGVPGSVGGTPVQNVGAYGQEVAQTIDSVEVLDTQAGKEREIFNPECQFKYRSSIFNTAQRGRFIITRVNYLLTHGRELQIAYADLKNHFADRKTAPTLAEIRQAVLQIRASKAMLIVPGDEDSRSAGSFFKNPLLSQEQYQQLHQRARARGLEIPNYPALEAQHKVSAAWLVEHSGFPKGYSNGAVGISRKHTLAIVNRGGAKAADIVALKDQIQTSVYKTWGIRLDTEPVMVGFRPNC